MKQFLCRFSKEYLIGENVLSDGWLAIENLLLMVSSIRIYDTQRTKSNAMDVFYEVCDGLRIAWTVGDLLMIYKDELEKKDQSRPLKDKKSLIRSRLQWAKGIIEQLGLFTLQLKIRFRKVFLNEAFSFFAWTIEDFRFQLNLVLELVKKQKLPQIEMNESYINQNEEPELLDLLNYFLEYASSETSFWKGHPGLYELCGEVQYYRSKGVKLNLLNEAKDHFHECLSKEPGNIRAILFKARTTVQIEKLRRETFGDDQMEEEYDKDATKDSVLTQAIKSEIICIQKLQDELSTLDQSTELIALKIEPLQKEKLTRLHALEVLLFNGLIREDLFLLEKRLCLIKLLMFDGTISGEAINRIRLLWKFSQNERVHLLDFFWAVLGAIEVLTQKECPNYFDYFSDESVELWEYLVTVLNYLPEDMIELPAFQAQLWRNRFFPNLLGFAQDPFAFYHYDNYIDGKRNMSLKKSH